jgi:diaminopimelate decarboxylase
LIWIWFQVHFDDIETDIEELGKKLSKRFLAFEKRIWSRFNFSIRTRKFLVSEAGFSLQEVNVVEQTNIYSFAGIDTGFVI